MILDFIDLLAIALIHIGNYFKIKRHYIGWAISMISITYFIGRAYYSGLWAQSLGHCISLSIAAYGFTSWYLKK